MLRCSGCHLLSYCGELCQKEHWGRVHKKYCKKISGKKPVANNSHDQDDCHLCLKQANQNQNYVYEPDTTVVKCNVEKTKMEMRKIFAKFFGFHSSTASCPGLAGGCTENSDDLPYLPFALGEISEEGFHGYGFDEILSHISYLIDGLRDKTRPVFDNHAAAKQALEELADKTFILRALLWADMMIFGNPLTADLLALPHYQPENYEMPASFLAETLPSTALEFGPIKKLNNLLHHRSLL